MANVGIGEERGIVIPMQAVRYGDAGAYVRMEDASGAIVEHPVTLGSGDGFFTIVESGLSEGDRIVMQALDDQQSRRREHQVPRSGREVVAARRAAKCEFAL